MNEYSRLTAAERAAAVLMGIGICGGTAYIFYRSITVFFLMFPVGLCYPAVKRREKAREVRETLRLQFKDGITLLASFLSAGSSVENAIRSSVRELASAYGSDGMIVREFSSMAHQLSVNRTVESVLFEFGERSGLDDVRQFAETFAVAKRNGGELASIMEHTAQVMAGKLRVREEILTMTAEKRFEQKIMSALPFLIILYIDLTSPGFFGVMYETVAGRAVMTVCLAVYAAAVWLAGKIMDIEV